MDEKILSKQELLKIVKTLTVQTVDGKVHTINIDPFILDKVLRQLVLHLPDDKITWTK